MQRDLGLDLIGFRDEVDEFGAGGGLAGFRFRPIRSGQGSLLVSREGWHEHPGIPIEVADTIGAGDALTAAMTHYLLRGAELAALNEAGNRWGGWVASQSGAMPPLSETTLAGMAAAIEG